MTIDEQRRVTWEEAVGQDCPVCGDLMDLDPSSAVMDSIPAQRPAVLESACGFSERVIIEEPLYQGAVVHERS